MILLFLETYCAKTTYRLQDRLLCGRVEPVAQGEVEGWDQKPGGVQALADR